MVSFGSSPSSDRGAKVGAILSVAVWKSTRQEEKMKEKKSGNIEYIYNDCDYYSAGAD